jgi:DNA-directed RNA polymerase subunit RPC12/RpoP
MTQAPRELFERRYAGGTAAAAGRCPVCRSRIVVESGEDLVVKNSILRVERRSGRVSAKCSRCKAWVPVPLRYTG